MVQEIIFKATADTGNSNAKIQELEKELAGASKESINFQNQLKAIGDKVNSGTATMREMAKAVKDYQTVALNAGRETPVGQYAIKQAAELSDKIGDLRNEINRTASDGKNLQGAMQIGSGIVAGYGALQGAMALVGSENENLQKTFVKLQAIQSVLMGIEQIRLALEKESSAMILIRTARTKVLAATEYIYATAVGTTTGAMKALRLSMLALPIVAIIAGVTALSIWLYKLSQSGEDLKTSNDRLIGSYDRLTSAMERSNNKAKVTSDRQIELAKAQGKSIQEIHYMEIDAIDDADKRRKVALSKQINYINELEFAKFKANQQGDAEEKKRIAEKLKEAKEQKTELIDLEKTYAYEKQLKIIEFNNKEKEIGEKVREERLSDQKKYNELSQAEQDKANALKLEKERLYQDLVIANIANDNERAIAELAINQQRELEATKTKYGEKSAIVLELQKKQATEMIALIDKQDEEFNAKQDESIAIDVQKQKDKDLQILTDKKANAEARLLQIEDEFYAEQELKLELAQIELEILLENEKLTADEKFLIEEEYQKKVRDINQETADHNKELKQQEISNAIEWTSKGISAVQSVTDAYFSVKSAKLEKGSREEEALARKQFKIQKALMLTMAGIDATKAILTSLAQSPVAIGPIPSPAGIASLAFATVTGIASIAKIASTQFTGGGSSGGSSVTPPSVNIPTSNTTNLLPDQTTQTGGLSGGSSQVVIVDSDIKTSLVNLDKVEVLSKFG